MEADETALLLATIVDTRGQELELKNVARGGDEGRCCHARCLLKY
jgi:hypothetical protein